MLFPQPLWTGLADGSVTLAFRRWRRPTVKAGGTLQSPGGLLGIDAVDTIELDEITDDDARAAGHATAAEAIAGLRPEGTLYRIHFHRIGDDPRRALRERADLDDGEYADLATRVARLDWARPVLEIIERHPATVSTDLAARLGVERPRFKERVRRLKALGLTESLDVGYRLSPRGQAFLQRLAADPERSTRRVMPGGSIRTD